MKDQFRVLRQVQQMQAKMAKVQEDLEQTRIEASAGGGAVKVVVTGSQKLVSISLDPELGSDLEMLQDLVVVAVNEAMESSRQLQASKMQEITAGLGLPPGLV
jgi:DNA-binding YbaB/EbfC family protein